MARPHQARNSEGYARDISTLSRLRGALIVDETLGADELKETLTLLDSLVEKLATLRRHTEEHTV